MKNLMAHRSESGIVLITRVGKNCTPYEQLLQPRPEIISEAQKIIVTELIDDDRQHQSGLLIGPFAPAFSAGMERWHILKLVL